MPRLGLDSNPRGDKPNPLRTLAMPALGGLVAVLGGLTAATPLERVEDGSIDSGGALSRRN